MTGFRHHQPVSFVERNDLQRASREINPAVGRVRDIGTT